MSYAVLLLTITVLYISDYPLVNLPSLNICINIVHVGWAIMCIALLKKSKKKQIYLKVTLIFRNIRTHIVG